MLYLELREEQVLCVAGSSQGFSRILKSIKTERLGKGMWSREVAKADGLNSKLEVLCP